MNKLFQVCLMDILFCNTGYGLPLKVLPVISESRKKCFLNMCSILKCCSTFLSLLSLFCFYILQIRIERWVSLMVIWDPGWLSDVTSDIVGFSNKVEMVVGGGLYFRCACFSWDTIQMCLAHFLCRKEYSVLTSWKTSVYSQNPSNGASMHFFFF